MRLGYLTLAAIAAALSAMPQTANAQTAIEDMVRGRVSQSDVRRKDRDDRYDRDDRDDRWRRDTRPGRRVGQDEAWLRRQRAQWAEWCRRHRNDRRCEDFYRGRNGSNWCWDRDRDRRCDNVADRRRDSRGVIRSRDRGPEWDRWLRSNELDAGELTPLPVPR